MSTLVDPESHQVRVSELLARHGQAAFLLTLLIAEVLALTLRFDVGRATIDHPWLASGIQALHYLPQIALAVALATLLASRAPRGVTSPAAAPASDRPTRFPPYVLGHLAAMTGFALLAPTILEGTRRSAEELTLTLIAWAALGTAGMVFWALALMPFENWAAGLRRHRGILILGLLSGLGIWAASLTTPRLWEPLAGGTFRMVDAILRLLGFTVVSRPWDHAIGTSGFRVVISPQCSGYEGIGLILGFVALYLWCFRDQLRFPQSLVLFPVGVVTIWLANALRIAALIVIGDRVSPEVAVGGFHSLAGWLAFVGIALALIVTTQSCSFFRRQAPPCPEALTIDADADAGPAPARAPAAYLMPLLVLIATAMLTGAASAGFDRLYGLRVLTVGITLWIYRRDLRAAVPAWSWSAAGIGVLVFGLWIALEPNDAAPGAALRNGLENLSPTAAVLWMAARMIGSVLIVPVAEELAFRGYLLRRLQADDFESVSLKRWSWWPCLISSACFGVLHGRWLAGTLAGFAYALAPRRSGRLGDAILAHAVTNAMIAFTVVATGNWSLWA